jgi:two-component system NarL family sensor kinase
MSQQSLTDVLARPSTARIRGTSIYRPVRWLLEAVFCVAFVIGVYEAVVAGAIGLWPNASVSWMLPVWVLASSLCGLGLGPVRRLARSTLRRAWTSAADDPYAALARTVAGARHAEPTEQALARLAEIAVESTGARSAVVVRQGFDVEAEGDAFAIRADGRVLGELVVRPPARRPLTDSDRRLAASLADAAGSVLHNTELTEWLDERLRFQEMQAGELDRSRRRVVAARDEARELLSRRIESSVGETLAWCAQRAAELRDEDVREWPPKLAEITERIDTSIKEFRRIVHGLYPAALTDHGLGAALASLVTELPGRATYRAPAELPRFQPRFEAGVYFCMAALLEPLAGKSDDALCELKVELAESELGISVDGVTTLREPGVLDAVRDRVAALNGEFVLDDASPATPIRLRVPMEPISV